MQSPDRSSTFISSSNLLRAARLVAGFGDIELASEVLALENESYADFERGFFPQLDTIARIARLFGVSLSFLSDRSPVSDRERFAFHLAKTFAALKETKLALARFSEALIAVRIAAGFATPAAAATAKGWNVLLYTAHEERARPLSLDQLVVYSLAFGFHPDEAMLAQKPRAIWGEARPWWKEQTREDHALSGALAGVAFEWLGDSNCASDMLHLPVVEMLNGKWTLGAAGVHIPRLYLPGEEAGAGETLYAIADRYTDTTRIFVVDPTVNPGTAGVMIDARGKVEALLGASGRTVDPLQSLLHGPHSILVKRLVCCAHRLSPPRKASSRNIWVALGHL